MKSLSSLVNFVKRQKMKLFRSWYFGVIIVWFIVLMIIWIKGEFIDVKTPWEFIIYVCSAILAIAGITITIIGTRITPITVQPNRVYARFV